MGKTPATVLFLALVLPVLRWGTVFAGATEVVWARDAGVLLGGTISLALATLCSLSLLAGWRAALQFLAAGLVISWLAEVAGLQGGWLFGATYRYHPEAGPMLPGGIPVFIPLAWFALAGIPVMLLQGWSTLRPNGRRDPRQILVKSAVAALGLVALDLALDPIAVALGLWTWHPPGPYFGVPGLNFAGWWVTGLVVFLAGYGATDLGRADGSRIPLRYDLAWGAACAALLAMVGVGVVNRTGSSAPWWLAVAVLLPLGLRWLAGVYWKIQLRRAVCRRAGT